MKIIESLNNYFSKCDLIVNLGAKINVDFLKEKDKSFSIEPVPVNPTVRNYIGGGGERQYAFVIAVKFNYSDEARMNLDNSGFFEDFAEWIESQSELENLPVLGVGKTATKLEITSNGYLFGITQDMKYGRYQIQCRLLYDVE